MILSSALYGSYFPLLVVATYVVAPFPNFICQRFQSGDDFMSEGSPNGVVDFGRFFTGFLVVMGVALPVLLSHCGIIRTEAMVMSILGGLLIYGTIISFTMFFQETEEF